MQFDLQRTIVAVSSGLAPANRALVRLSGNETSRMLRQLVSAAAGADLARLDDFLASHRPRSEMFACSLSWPDRSIECRIYFWPTSRCFTGEQSAELHLLGSLPVVESLVKRLIELGARPADRGEFTLRSFLAGKLDLTQAEGVLGVIEAQGPQQLDAALALLGGNISHPVRELRSQLLELIAHLEAGLDFVEEDIEFISEAMLTEQLTAIAVRLSAIAKRLETRGSGSRNRQVVLAGLPNAGKSSLFNALLGSERAIVTEHAGTTRDAIVDTIRVAGLPIEIIDTAGIELIDDNSPRRMAQGVVEQRLEQADLILFCVDLTDGAPSDAIFQALRRCREGGVPVVVVGTKCDIAGLHSMNSHFEIEIAVSARIPQSIVALKQKLIETLAVSTSDAQSDALHRAAIRSKTALDLAIASIERAQQLLDDQLGEELVAAELRNSIDELAAVIGEVHTEDILGEIFSRFCIGK